MYRYFKYFLGLVILATLAMAAFHFFIEKSMSPPVDKLVGALGLVTNSEVKIDGFSLTLASEETRELIVVKRETQSVVKYESSWLGS